MISAEALRKNVRNLQARIERACNLCKRNPGEITLVAVTKYIDAPVIDMLWDCGIRHIGENRVQDAEKKLPLVKNAFTRHFIGHLQTNKAKKAVKLFSMFHSIDRIEIASELQKTGKPVEGFIQVNVTGERTKHGVSPEKIDELLNFIKFSCPSIRPIGFMTMAEEGRPERRIRETFRKLREIAELYKLPHLSIGMSQDFEIAIQEGATFLRIGSLLYRQ